MRKLFTNKNKKGFAMAELLAVSIVLLFIFSILFSNYLPLVAEYENRLSYNDVTAQYAAHYIRKMYKEALLDTDLQTQFDDVKTGKVGYMTVYKKGDTSQQSIYNHIGTVTNSSISWADSPGKKELKKKEIENVINEYGIEEIIITRYKLEDVKANYSKGSGSLYNYIKYLPSYEKSIYTGNDLSTDSIQLYRIILKTKDYGYATTPILSDYRTPDSCFKFANNDDGKTKTITDYLFNEDNGCGKMVIIKSTPIDGKYITKIGDDAFKDNPIESVQFSDKITFIGKSAFEGTHLKDFNIPTSVTTIGYRAFANTDINKITLSTGIVIGDYAFAENKNLESVTLPNSNIYPSGSSIPTKGLFARSGNGASGIAVTIPGKMINVGDEMFYLAKVKSIALEEGVKTIGDKAFSQFNGSSLINNKLDSHYTKITIPSSVINIGYGKYTAGESLADISDCFRGLGITELIFTSSDKELLIGASAFRNNNIDKLTIPPRVKEIGGYAFENSNITTLSFEEGSKLIKIGVAAFTNNNINGIVLPDDIESIGAEAFKDNPSLKTVSLPNNQYYDTISGNLFNGKSSLTTITIPSYVKIIGESAFNPSTNTNSLEEVIFAEGSQLTTINGLAFANNKKLRSFIIPEKVTIIKNKAFASCPNLTEITNNSSKIIDKLYSNGCEIFFLDDSNGTCSSSISDDRKNIVISYEKGYTVTITNNNVG